MGFARLDNELIGAQTAKSFVNDRPADIGVSFGIERRLIQGFNVLIVQWLNLMQPEEAFPYFDPNLGAVVQGSGDRDVNVLRANGTVGGRLGNRQVRLEVAEQLELAVGENGASDDDHGGGQQLYDAGGVA